MNGATGGAQTLPEVRSKDSNRSISAAFVSQTNRKVDIFWIDFKGKYVKYATLTKHGDAFPIVTYVTHPWIFKDAESGDPLVISGNQEVYYPKPLEPNDMDVVLIGIPVYSLRTRCLQVARKLWRESQIPSLEMPRTLQEDAVKKINIDFIQWDEYEVV